MKNAKREVIKDKIAPPGKWFAADLNLEIIEDYIQPITLNAIGCKYDGAKQVLGLLFNIKRQWYVWIPKWDDLWDTCFLGTYIEHCNKGNTDKFAELANEILSLVKPEHTINMEEGYQREVNKAFHLINGPAQEIYRKEVHEGIRPDIVEIISQHVSLTKTGRIFRGLCPFHNEKSGSFFVYPEQQTWHCFGACNTGGDVLSFLARLHQTNSSTTENFQLSNIRIIESEPKKYIVSVNGTDIELGGLAELISWGHFKIKVLSKLNFIPTRPKNWEDKIKKLLQSAERIQGPDLIESPTEIKLSVRRWFEQRGSGEEYSDIQAGCYIQVEYEGRKYRAFTATPLLRWLKRDLGKTVTRDDLWAIVSEYGGVHHQWRVGEENIPVRLWALPEEWF